MRVDCRVCRGGTLVRDGARWSKGRHRFPGVARGSHYRDSLFEKEADIYQREMGWEPRKSIYSERVDASGLLAAPARYITRSKCTKYLSIPPVSLGYYAANCSGFFRARGPARRTIHLSCPTPLPGGGGGAQRVRRASGARGAAVSRGYETAPTLVGDATRVIILRRSEGYFAGSCTIALESYLSTFAVSCKMSGI